MAFSVRLLETFFFFISIAIVFSVYECSKIAHCVTLPSLLSDMELSLSQ